MSKDKVKGFVVGVLVSAMLFGTGLSVFATVGSQNVQITYRNIDVVIDGYGHVLFDSDNKYIEPFIYNGSVYMPLRAIAEMFGKEVEWVGESNQVKITTPAPDKFYDTESQFPNFDVVINERNYSQGENTPITNDDKYSYFCSYTYDTSEASKENIDAFVSLIKEYGYAFKFTSNGWDYYVRGKYTICIVKDYVDSDKNHYLLITNSIER